MKKLMIAAAIVCAAVFAHGAQFYWGIANTSIMGPGTEADGYVDGEGYLLDGFASLIVAGETIATAPNINGDFTFGPTLQSLTDDETGTLTGLARGDISETFEGQPYQIILTTLDGKYEVVIEDTSTFRSEAAGDLGDNYNYEVFVTMNDINGWTEVGGGGDDPSEGVPEPTSGLLMLVGLAGLALKRKIA